MIEMACPWELSRKLVYLGFSDESVYKWVHPWQSSCYKENKTRYIIVDRVSVLDRTSYPAYSIEELLNQLPDEYILGRINNEWYCKSFSESFSDVMYYAHPILACAYTAIFVAEVKTRKAEEDKTEEVNLKKGGILGETKRKLIVDITGKPFTFCCGAIKEFVKSQHLYLDFQIRDMGKPDPTNPCLLLEDERGHRSWYTCCPFCGADIVVKEVKRKNKAEETKVTQKEDKAVIELWLKKETLKHLRILAHKQPEAFLSQEEEIATYIEKLIDARPTTWSSEDRFGNILRVGWKKNEKL